MSENIRCFIAIPLTQEIKEELVNIQEKLKKSDAGVKWVSPDSIHLTLKFLGDIPRIRLSSVSKMIKEVAHKKTWFEMSLSSLGAFPSIGKPRIVWIGIEDGQEELKELAEKLDLKLRSIGLPGEEREFVPHLTLGRVKKLDNRDKLVEIIHSIKAVFTEKMQVTKINLMKSQLTSTGPIYSVISTAHLPPQ
ncbi:MAG: RNA 2',3'-cyclic phosphodiesterase [bacterium]|nr:RNA 2',3'-cyclic phosphodiesterase [bacterium]